MSVSRPRRAFVRSGAVASLAGAIASIHARPAPAVTPAGLSELVDGPYGPPSPVRDRTTGLALVELPPGFEYASGGWAVDPMSDGRPTPGATDGMGVVRARAVDGRTELVLVRNHERVTSIDAADVIGAGDAAVGKHDTGWTAGGTRPAYSAGGTTNLVFRDGEWIGAPSPSLGGTRANCAGGVTPWGTWLSCEEGIVDAPSSEGRRHGYVFEVDADDRASGAPIAGMGRFRHEAAAVDPATGHVYLTEDDRGRSGLYRYLPRETPGATKGTRGSLERGGRLQMARVRRVPNAALLNRTGAEPPLPVRVGATFGLDWVDVREPDADRAAQAVGVDGTVIERTSGPFAQGWAQGALRMARGEGLWHHRGAMLLVDTAGSFGTGVLWRLDLASQVLECVYAGQATGGAVTPATLAGNMVDNVCASPRGGILMCEDGGGGVASLGQRLLGVLPGGDVYPFLRNRFDFAAPALEAAGKAPMLAGDRRDGEIAGACFDPTGRWLFVNLYSPGVTLAITGPWARGNL